MKRPRNNTARPPVATEPLLTETHAALHIKMSKEFLRKDRRGKRIFPFVKIGSAVRYRRSDLDAAVARLVIGGGE